MRRLLLNSLFLLLPCSACAQNIHLSFAKFPPAKTEEYDYVPFIVLLHQKSLFDYPPDVDVYRFIDCDAWGRGYLAIITHKNDASQFEGVQPASHPVKGKLGITTAVNRPLTTQEWRQFNLLLARTDFWNVPTTGNRDGLDGYTYILEARAGGRYHYIILWAPDGFPEDKAFSKLGLWIDTLIPDRGTVSTNDGWDVTTGNGNPVTTNR